MSLQSEPPKKQHIITQPFPKPERVALRATDVLRGNPTPIPSKTALMLYVEGVPDPIVIALQEELTMGRSLPYVAPVPHLDLSAYQAYEKGVSRQHSKLIVQDGVLKVMDLGSTNATYLNGEKLVPYHPQAVNSGDEVFMGQFMLRIEY